MKPATRTTLRHIVVWLLACLVPLQAIAACVIAVIGPAHVHKTPSPAAATHANLVLSDFRRLPISSAPRATHVATALGHFHAGGAAARHHHPRSDSSVEYTGFDAPGGATDADEGGLGLSLAAFVGLIPTAAAWQPIATQQALAARPPWVASTHDPERLERPPRAS